LRVIAVDHRPWALGLRSRYAEEFLAPDPVSDEEGFVVSLRALADRLEEPVPVFPTHDEHLNAIAKHLDELDGRFLCPFPAWETLERVQSKRHQLEQAQELGLAVPRTAHPQSAAAARAAADDFAYPVLVKPSDNVVFKRIYRRQAFLCENPPEVERAYALAESFEPMVQEFIPGGDEHLWTLGSYLAPGGEALGLFSGHKLRQTRGWMGSARVGESAWDGEVVDSGLRLLRALGFHGISQVEWKRDPRDGRLKLIEVNPRLWQWHGLASACGVDIPWIAYRDLVGDRPAPARMDVEGKRWAISFMFGTKHGMQRPPYVDGVFALDDPKPALVQVYRLARKAARLNGDHSPEAVAEQTVPLETP
jgi:predicted ATP-grasp superfamily ATP-dependent carboligase